MSMLPSLEIILKKGLSVEQTLDIEKKIKDLSSVFNTSMSGGGDEIKIHATLSGSSQQARIEIAKIEGVESIRHAL